MASQKLPRIFSCLQTLSKEEFQRFADFVASPYFCSSGRLSELVNGIAPYYPFVTAPTDSEAWQGAGWTAPFHYGTLRNRYSDLYSLFLRFVATEQMLGNKEHVLEAQIAQLRIRRLPDLADKLLESPLKRARTEPQRSTRQLDHLQTLLFERSLLDTVVRPGENREILQEQLNVLVERCIAELLRQYTLMIHESYQHSQPLEYHLAPEVLAFISHHPEYRRNVSIDVHTAVLELSANPTEESYSTLMELILRRVSEMSFLDGYMAFTHASDHCMFQINVVGNRRYFRYAYENFQSKISAGYVVLGNILYPDFIYFVRMAAHCGEFSAARSFIQRFAPGLMDSVRADVVRFCNAFLAQKQGDFAGALGLYAMVNIPQPTIRVLIRIYSIQCMIALRDTEGALLAADALRHLKTDPDTLSHAHRKAVAQFTRMVPRLASLLRSPKHLLEKRRENLLREVRVMDTNYFDMRNWLEDAINEVTE